MTKDKRITIPVTRKTYDVMLEKKVLLETAIMFEHKEKALENGNKTENLQDSTVEFHPTLTVSETRLHDIKKALENVEIVSPEMQQEVVKIGNIVVLQYPTQLVTMRVDGISYEKNVLSLQSPLGKLIMGHPVGKEVEVNKLKVIIKKIHLPEL